MRMDEWTRLFLAIRRCKREFNRTFRQHWFFMWFWPSAVCLALALVLWIIGYDGPGGAR